MRFRVGIDGHVLDGRNQGSKSVLTGLLHAISTISTQYEFVIYCFDPEKRRAEFKDVPFQFKKVESRNGVRRLLFEFPRIFRRDEIDISIFQYILPPLTEVPTIIFVHDILPLTNPEFFPLLFRLRMSALLPISIRKSAAIVTVSSASKNAIAARFSNSVSNVHIIPNGPSFPIDAYFNGDIKPTTTLPSALKPGRFIINIGRIEPRKNHDLLVRAFLRADIPDVDLVIVGQNDLGYTWQPPRHPRIRVIDNADNELLVALYRSAGLFVNPSLAEGFSIPLLDAILFGVPTLSSNTTSMPEVGVELVEYFDPRVTGVEKILADRIAAHFGEWPIPHASEHARRQHADRFSWRSAAYQLLQLIENVGQRQVSLSPDILAAQNGKQ